RAPLGAGDDRSHRGRVDSRAAGAERGPRAFRSRVSDARGDHGRPRARSLPTPEGGRARMTSIEVPYSIAAALPTLSVMDITNEVSKSVAASGRTGGIAYVSAT